MQEPTQAEIDNMLCELAEFRPRRPISWYLAGAERIAAKLSLETWQVIVIQHGMKQLERERR